MYYVLSALFIFSVSFIWLKAEHDKKVLLCQAQEELRLIEEQAKKETELKIQHLKKENARLERTVKSLSAFINAPTL
jgi:hypothetical protein